MTPTPPSASSSRMGNSPDYRVVRKRNRIPLSCAPCRHRKLKCNRQSPCDNCIKRGDGASCAYAAPATRKKGSTSASANASPDDMQNRIDRLEGLVLSLMTNGSQSAGPEAAVQALSAHSGSIGSGSLGPNLDATLDESRMMDLQSDRGGEESETDGVTQSLGVMKVDTDQQKTIYLGEAHWAALLNEISEVKSYFAAHRKEYEAQLEKVAQARRAQGNTDSGSGPALLFGASIPPSRNEILGQLPSRYTCDILVGRYFNTYDPATHILHGPAFQRQYNNHWADPSKTSIVWIGMLFSMLRLAMISYGREGDEPPEFRGKCHDLASTYRTQMAHCMITADYTKPHNFIIETLIFHLTAEYTSNRDSEASVWVLAGMIARFSMRMGYHRDSKMFPNITPFQGEMRRRIWTFVRSADLLFSFQLALPSMIRLGDSDTDLPRNIYDDEFDEDSKELPPPRPSNEATSISYMIAKGRLALGFGRVLEETNGIAKHGYEEILKIDKGLQEIYHSIPDHLKLKPMEDQQMSPLTLIMARFGLATIYHKSQCVLHRRYVRLARGNNKYMHSRRSCIDSAMQLLSFQAVQHHQSQDRGRMRSLRNYVNSLATHDFLLAASVVCMDLYNQRDKGESNDISTPSTSMSGNTGNSSTGGSSSDTCYISGLSYTRDDLIRALEQSRDIWWCNRDFSMEAYKASELLNVLLYHIRMPFSPGPSQTIAESGKMTGARMGDLGPTAATTTANSGSNGNSNDEQTAAMTLGMLQAGGLTSSNPQATAAAAAALAQQGLGWDTTNTTHNGATKANPMMAAFLNGNLNVNPSGGAGGNGGGLGSGLGSGFAGSMPLPSPGGVFGSGGSQMLPDMLFGGNGGAVDLNMNFDWDTWDQYMQPSNLSLDPAATLWGNTSPDSNVFTSPQAQQQQNPSPDANSSAQNNANNSNSNPVSNSSNHDTMFGTSFFSPSPNQAQARNSTGQAQTGGQAVGADLPRSETLPNINTNRGRDAEGRGHLGVMDKEKNLGTGGETFMGASTPGGGGWRWTVMSGDRQGPHPGSASGG